MSVPTAEEILNKKFSELKSSFDLNDVKDCMVEFAKLHVEAALKEASVKTYKASIGHGNVYHTESAKDSILNSYPLDKIK
jgi:hypothetical protein